MENKNNKVEKEIVDTKVSKKVEDTEITMIDEFILDGVETEELEQESFVKAEIYAHIDSIRKDLNDPSKFQFKTAFIDEITGDDVVNTFKVSVELTKSTEETLKDLRKKYVGVYVKASDVNIVPINVVRDNNNKIVSRDFAYGADLENIEIITDWNQRTLTKDLDTLGFINNHYVVINLTSVADITKNVNKKPTPTGDVKLISFVEEDGEMITWDCKLSIKGTKLNKGMFQSYIGKDIKINGLKENRYKGLAYISNTLPSKA